MQQLALIAAGGASGALLRYWLSGGIHAVLGRSFPYGTLSVNVIGSFAMGLLYIYVFEHLEISEEWRALIGIGLLGAFTTFSTFSIETLNLVEAGKVTEALLNVFLNVFLCLGACWLGLLLSRQV